MNESDKSSKLGLLCREGSLSEVQLLICQGANVNKGDREGNTPLHIVANRGFNLLSKYVIRSLLEAGADPNVKDTNGNTPLYRTCIIGSLQTAKELINGGADIRARNTELETPLHIATRFSSSDIVSLLLRRGVSPGLRDINGNTPLHTTISLRIARMLIEGGADINSRNNRGETPLHRACQFGYHSMAKFLVDSCANINIGDYCNRSPLYHACIHGEVKLVKLLAPIADIEMKCDQGQTALHVACGIDREGRLEMIKTLVYCGADCYTLSNGGLIPLNGACKYYETIEFMIKFGVKVNERHRRGMTLLHMAASWGDIGAVSFLIRNGAISVPSEIGSMPSDTARSKDNKELNDMLARCPGVKG